jgi:hypothetical protein
MREGFEHWKDRLEDEDAQDIVPGFDAQATWQKLQPRIAKKQPVKWQLFAAAMLVGLLIGAAVMRLWTGNATTSVTVVKNPTQVVKETVAVHDTVYTAAPSQPRVITVVKTTPTRRISKPAPQQIAPAPEVQQQETPIGQSTAPQHEETAVAMPKPKPRVIHLMDVENEDKKMVLSSPAQPQHAAVVSVLSSRIDAGSRPTTKNSVIGVSLKN